MMTYYSRTANVDGRKEKVSEHLQQVSQLCGDFADAFGCAAEGRAIGLWHDLGKYSETFKGVLEGSQRFVDHASPGAAAFRYLYVRRQPAEASPFWPLVVAIKAHHGQLDQSCAGELEALRNGAQYNKNEQKYSLYGRQLDQACRLLIEETQPLPEKLPQPAFAGSLDYMLHTRMLLSCLVDADYSGAAQHFQADYLQRTTPPPLDCARAFAALDAHRRKLAETGSDAAMSRIRENLFQQCLAVGREAGGLFTLTAPTGSGKTLAMLAFALSQVQHQHKERIIIVLPYLSITEQNAAVYRQIIPDLLEDHSQSNLSEESRELAARWSARLIVTTSVRFFESLFASRASRCRYLHHLVNSVIIFDEAQSLPPRLTGVTLQSVNILCQRYHCSVVFSTATQPAFSLRQDVDWQPREIVENTPKLFASTRRVQVDWRLDRPLAWDELARELMGQRQVCCIVNLRKQARLIYGDLLQRGPAQEGLFLLSTDLCPRHRLRILDEVRERLVRDLPCCLISTQCIEAGVDISFPCLYRALAPLESIIQAAGRCNRHDLRRQGRVIVFIPAGESNFPDEYYRLAANKVLLLHQRHAIDINDLAHIAEYYRYLFTDQASRDNQRLLQAVKACDYAEVSRQYRLIDKEGVSILVPDDPGLFTTLRDEALDRGLTADILRQAAPITVSSYDLPQVRQYCLPLPPRLNGRRQSNGDSGWYYLGNPDHYDSYRRGLVFPEAEVELIH